MTAEVPTKTALLLDQMVQPHRPNMKAEKKLLYANPETGTLVYQVLTSNQTLPYPTGRYYCWASFLVGNENGFMDVGFHLESEANVRIGEVVEDGETITVQRSGYETTHFELRMPVGNLVVKKTDLKPYPEEVRKVVEPPPPPVSRGLFERFMDWLRF